MLQVGQKTNMVSSKLPHWGAPRSKVQSHVQAAEKLRWRRDPRTPRRDQPDISGDHGWLGGTRADIPGECFSGWWILVDWWFFIEEKYTYWSICPCFSMSFVHWLGWWVNRAPTMKSNLNWQMMRHCIPNHFFSYKHNVEHSRIIFPSPNFQI